MSIFLANDEIYDFIGNSETLRQQGDESIEVIFHDRCPRRGDLQYVSNLSAHALEIGEKTEDADYVEGEFTKPSSRNKIGGDVYLLHRSKEVVEIVNTLIEQGFTHFLQLDISMLGNPERKIFISGKFPYGDGLLHIYLKPTSLGYDWRCFWQL